MKQIAILGKPNVGKSSLFNRLIRKNEAITSDISGTTRDFKKAVADFVDEDGNTYKDSYELIDTAGVDKKNIYSKEIIAIALEVAQKADIILYIVDGKSIAEDDDRKLFFELNKLDKPTALIVNKIDNDKDKENFWQFDSFGTKNMYATSITQNRGVSALQDWLDSEVLGEIETEEFIPTELETNGRESIPIGIIGRTNVGKSSLLNSLLGFNRSIVSEIAGTTLDPVDESIDYKDKTLRFIDTAGIRRRGKIIGLEKYALMRTKKLMERSYLCILVLDATEPMNRLDEKICGLVDKYNLAMIVVFNKWDKTIYNFDELKKEFKHRFKFLEYAPILTISALTSRNVDKLKDKILDIYEKYSYRIPTSTLNDIIQQAIAKHPIPRKKHKSVRILYATQYDTRPPKIALSVNKDDALHFSYQRYLVNSIREQIDFEGVPIVLKPNKRESNTEKKSED